MYKYLDRSPKVGDIIEINPERNQDFSDRGWFTKALHIVENLDGFECVIVVTKPDESDRGRLHFDHCKVVKTKPGVTAKGGDSVICLANVDEVAKCDAIFHEIPYGNEGGWVGFKSGHSWKAEDFLVLCPELAVISLHKIYDKEV